MTPRTKNFPPLDNWVLKRVAKRLLTHTPIVIGLLALVLNDWRVNNFSFSDPLILLGVLLLMPTALRMSGRQLLVILSSTLLVIINTLVASIASETYSVGVGVAYVVKINLYLLFSLLLYNHIVRNALYREALNILLFFAVTLSLIGIYISTTISLGLGLPYEPLWQFTRQDADSYIFQGHSDITRTRSIMSEPQHLGLFLNLTLTITLLGGFYSKKYLLPVLIVATTAILTLSFSTIPVTLLILILFLITTYGPLFFLRRGFIALSLCAVVISIPLWSSLETTIFSRTEQISEGSDESATLRLTSSWSHVQSETIMTGGGVGSTPYIWNNYAYALSDFGIIGLGVMVVITYILFRRNPLFGMLFAIFTFQKGGYLSGYYWMLVLLLFIFSNKDAKRSIDS